MSLVDSIMGTDINSAAGILYNQLNLNNSLLLSDIATNISNANKIICYDNNGIPSLASVTTLSLANDDAII